MKINFRLIVFILLAAFLLTPTRALAQDISSSQPDKYVFGDNFTLESGETLDEDLYVFGGNIEVQSGAVLSGDIWLTGGNLTIDGEVGGDVHATGGSIRLGSTAVIDGDIELTGASIDRDPSATVGGEVNRTSTGPLELTPGNWSMPWVATMANNIFTDVFSVFLWSFLLAALAVVVVIFWPKQVALTGTTAIQQPVVAGGLGILTMIAAVVILTLLAITIILSPISIIGFLALAVLALFGWIALGYEVGHRLMKAFKTEWALPVSAGLGTLLMTFIARGIDVAFDCVGWTIPFAIGMIGLGAVLITRLGTQPYPPSVVPVTAPIAVSPASTGGAEMYPAPDDRIPPAM
jgi:hypothetical protein